MGRTPAGFILQLTEYRSGLMTRQGTEGPEVWDPVRRKYLVATPEEVVRQLFIRYLLAEEKVRQTQLSVEREIRVMGRRRRYDLMVHDRSGTPLALVEIKAPEVTLTQRTIDQVVRYNLTAGAKYLVLTNGWMVHVFRLDPVAGTFSSLGELPDFRAE